IKVIDLLNKISKGEEVPKKIRIDHWRYKFEWVEHLDNYYDNSADIDLMSALSMGKEELNYGVEIIEEEKKIELPEKLNYNEKEFEDDAVDLKYSKGILRMGNVINELSKTIDELIDYV